MICYFSCSGVCLCVFRDDCLGWVNLFRDSSLRRMDSSVSGQ